MSSQAVACCLVYCRNWGNNTRESVIELIWDKIRKKITTGRKHCRNDHTSHFLNSYLSLIRWFITKTCCHVNFQGGSLLAWASRLEFWTFRQHWYFNLGIIWRGNDPVGTSSKRRTEVMYSRWECLGRIMGLPSAIITCVILISNLYYFPLVRSHVTSCGARLSPRELWMSFCW